MLAWRDESLAAQTLEATGCVHGKANVCCQTRILYEQHNNTVKSCRFPDNEPMQMCGALLHGTELSLVARLTTHLLELQKQNQVQESMGSTESQQFGTNLRMMQSMQGPIEVVSPSFNCFCREYAALSFWRGFRRAGYFIC